MDIRVIELGHDVEADRDIKQQTQIAMADNFNKSWCLIKPRTKFWYHVLDSIKDESSVDYHYRRILSSNYWIVITRRPGPAGKALPVLAYSLSYGACRRWISSDHPTTLSWGPCDDGGLAERN